MYKKIIDFEIRPIFNPSDEICKDFERIELRCDDYLGNIYKEEYRQSCWEYHKENFQNQNAFAFAAYHKNKMVGFSDGYADDNVMNLDSLFVDPDFHGKGIGSGLLKNSEYADSIIKSNMELMPLITAMDFYQKHRYVYGRNGVYMQKTLSAPIPGVIPVFEWCDELTAKLNVKIDSALLRNCKGQPMFVCVNKYADIEGIALRLPDGKDVIKFTKRGGDTAEQYKSKLVDALSKTR